jgi:hypothetical protein
MKIVKEGMVTATQKWFGLHVHFLTQKECVPSSLRHGRLFGEWYAPSGREDILGFSVGDAHG